MAYPEIWTENSVLTYEKVITNLIQYSSANKVNEFVKRVEEVISFLNVYPEMYEKSFQRGEIRRCVVIPDISLFYSFDNEFVVLLQFWDNRADPSKIIFE